MGTMTIVDATLTPSGEKHIMPPDRERQEQQKLYVYAGGRVFEVETVTQELHLIFPGRPKRIFFGAINHPLLRLKAPVPVDISEERGTVVAFCAELEEFGYGESLSDALDDFGKTIRELYFSLETQEGKLSEHLKRIQSRLHQYLEPRRGAQ